MDLIKMLEFSSDLKQLKRVETFVNDLLTEYHISDDLYGNILISLTEAVNNAITHGNKLDKSKKVKVLSFKEKNKITFRVRDEGEGFDYNNIPDPTAPENILKVSGRGVFLMKKLSDEVLFEKNGSEIEMRFLLNTALQNA